MRSFFRLAVAVAMSLSLATPGFAYVFQSDTAPERASRRSIDSAARGANDISDGITRSMRMRKNAEDQDNGLSKLRRASGQHFRSVNRKPKEGSDRYRTLHPNTRSLRRQAEGMDESMLPNRLVQTGGIYDHVTRRDSTELSILSPITPAGAGVFRCASKWPGKTHFYLLNTKIRIV